MASRPSQAQARAVNPVLQNLLIGYANAEESYIGTKLLPPVPTEEQQTGTIYTINRGDMHGHRINTLEWGLGSRAHQSPGFGTSTATYTCERFAEEVSIDKDAIRRSDIPLDLKALQMQVVAEDMALAQERRIANAFFSTGNFAQNRTLGAGEQWITAAGAAVNTANPIEDISLGIETVENNGRSANAIVFGRMSWYGFLRNPAVLEFLAISKDRLRLTPAEARALLLERFDNFKNVYVGKARQRTSNPNQTFTATDLWGDGVWIGHLSDGTNMATGMGKGSVAVAPTAVARFVEYDWTVDEYEDEPLKSEVVRISLSEDVLVTSAPDGYYLADTQAAA